MIYIGCDPAFRLNGHSICIDDGESIRFITFKRFPNFIGWIFTDRPEENAIFCVENSNLQKEIFAPNKTLQRACSVGKNMAISELTYWIAQEYFGVNNTIQISPKQKGAKIDVNDAFNIKVFQKETGYMDKISQDEMDAYQIMRIGKQMHRMGILTSNNNERNKTIKK